MGPGSRRFALARDDSCDYFAAAVATAPSTPMRPKPGSFTAGWRRSRPATSPRTFTSIALDPAELDAEQAPQARLDAGAAVAQARVGQRAEVAADRVRRHRDAEFRHRAQHGRDERVAVRPRPDAVVARIGVLIALDRGLDPRDQRLGLCALEIHQHLAVLAEPQVGRPPVQPHRSPPAGDVVAAPGAVFLMLDDDPAMDRERALPAARAPRHHQNARFGMRRGIAEPARDVAIPLAPVRGAAASRQARRARRAPEGGTSPAKSRSGLCGGNGGAGRPRRTRRQTSLSSINGFGLNCGKGSPDDMTNA